MSGTYGVHNVSCYVFMQAFMHGTQYSPRYLYGRLVLYVRWKYLWRGASRPTSAVVRRPAHGVRAPVRFPVRSSIARRNAFSEAGIA